MPQDQYALTPDEFEERVGKSLGIPRDLRRALTQQESGGQQYDKAGNVLTSPKQARGRYQVLQSTADSVFGKGAYNVNDAYDNIYAGLSYLKQKYDSVDAKITDPRARWQAAVAAYHGGESQLNHINRTGGEIAPRSDGLITTPNYVDSVMTRWEGYSQQSAKPQPPPKPAPTTSYPADAYGPPVSDAEIAALKADPLTTGQQVKQARDAQQFAQQSTAVKVLSQFAQNAATGLAKIPQGLAAIADLIAASPTAQAGGTGTPGRVAPKPEPKTTQPAPVSLTSRVRPFTQTAEKTIKKAVPTDPNDQSFWTAKLPAAAGSTVPFILGGAATGGSRLATGLLGAASNVSDVAAEFDAAGGDPAKREQAIAAAAAVGLSEVFGIGKLLAKFGANRKMLELGKNVLQEGGQEAFQQWANNLIASDVGGYDPQRPASQGVLEAGKLGALVGSGFGAASKLARPLTSEGRQEAAQNEAIRSIRDAWAKRARPEEMPGLETAPTAEAQPGAESTTADAILGALGRGAAAKPDAKAAKQQAAEQRKQQAAARKQAAADAAIDQTLQAGESRLSAMDAGEWARAREAAEAEAAEVTRLAQLESDPARKQSLQRRAEELGEAGRDFAELAQMVVRGQRENERAEMKAGKEWERIKASSGRARLLAEKRVAEAERLLASEQAAYQKELVRRREQAEREERTRHAQREKQLGQAEALLAGEQRRFGQAQKAQTVVTDLSEQRAQLERQGDYRGAANLMAGEIEALKSRLATATALRERAQIATSLSAAQKQRADLERQARAQIKQQKQPEDRANQPTADLPASAPAPLLESVVNPEGGIAPPQSAPVPSFERLAERQAEAQQDALAGPRKPTADLSPVEYLKRKTNKEGIRVSESGERRMLSAKEQGIVGLTNRKSRFSPNDAAVMLDEGGFFLPDGRAFTDPSVRESDVVDFLINHGKQPALRGTGQIEERLSADEAEYYRALEEMEGQAEPTAPMQSARLPEPPVIEQAAASETARIAPTAPLASAFRKLGTDDAQAISDLYARADEVYRRSSSDAERAQAREARDLVGSLTSEEGRAIAEILPERRFAPVKSEDQPNYGRAVQDIALAEANPQELANFESVMNFFDEVARSDDRLSTGELNAARAQVEQARESADESVTPEERRIATGLNVLMTSTKGEAVRFRQLYDKLQSEELQRNEAYTLKSIAKGYGIPGSHIDEVIAAARQRRADQEAARADVERHDQVLREATTGQRLERPQPAQQSARTSSTPSGAERAGTGQARPASQSAAVSEEVGQQYNHADFGLVTESPNQQGVPMGKVRVTDEQGSEHIIQRPTGALGNQKAARVKAASSEPKAASSAENAALPLQVGAEFESTDAQGNPRRYRITNYKQGDSQVWAKPLDGGMEKAFKAEEVKPDKASSVEERFSGIPIDLKPTKQAILNTFAEGKRIAQKQGAFEAGKFAGKEVLNLFRGLTLSGDLPLLRQGAMVSLPPRYWAQTLKDLNAARRAWKDINFAKAKVELENLVVDVAKQPVAITKLAHDAGVQFSSDLFARTATRGQVEEGYESQIARSLPGFGNLEQMNAVFMDLRRIDVFRRYLDAAMRQPLSDEQLVKVAQDAAEMVNNLSGRAAAALTEAVRNEAGKVIEPAREKHNLTNLILRTGPLFWSPKYLVSRMRLLNPRTYTQLNPAIRREVAKDVAAFAGTVLATGLLAAQAGFTVSLDPDDSDFLKIKTADGKTRYDLAAGFGPLLRVYWQFAKTGTTMLPDDVRKKIGSDEQSSKLAKDTATESYRFLRGKLSPVPSYLALWLFHDWKEVTGEKVTPGQAAIKRTLPLMYQDFQEAYEKEQAAGLLKVSPIFIGAGVQQYEPKGNKSRLEISKQPGQTVALPHFRTPTGQARSSRPARPARPSRPAMPARQ